MADGKFDAWKCVGFPRVEDADGQGKKKRNENQHAPILPFTFKGPRSLNAHTNVLLKKQNKSNNKKQKNKQKENRPLRVS